MVDGLTTTFLTLGSLLLASLLVDAVGQRTRRVLADIVSRLRRANLIFDFSVEYVGRHDRIDPRVPVDEAMNRELGEFLKARGFEYTPEELSENYDDVMLRVRAQIARIRWGQVQEAQIIAEGETPEGVFVVSQGELEISHGGANGEGPRLPLHTDSLVGDVPLLSGRSYVGAITAKTAVVALRLPKDLFFELLETIPDFSLALTRDLASRLYRLADRTLHAEKVH